VGSQVLNTETEEEQDEVPKMRATLMELHQMLGHLAFEKILKLAKDPRSGLEISDDKIRTCVACAQGKQTKNPQSRKNSDSTPDSLRST
jgi:hypothetical protein